MIHARERGTLQHCRDSSINGIAIRPTLTTNGVIVARATTTITVAASTVIPPMMTGKGCGCSSGAALGNLLFGLFSIRALLRRKRR